LAEDPVEHKERRMQRLQGENCSKYRGKNADAGGLLQVTRTTSTSLVDAMTRGSMVRARAVKASRGFPPVDYWRQVERPHELKYQMSPRSAFTRDGMDGVPTDDDIIFRQLGLLILEDYGPDFTIEDVGRA